jgi:hypothetical protein
MWKITLLKRAALVLTVSALTFTWTQSGRTQGVACEPARGIDPLDVINQGVKHNVWILLDTSRSMTFDWFGNMVVSPPNESRLDTAKDVLSDLIMTTLVDPNTDEPYVNWGFINFGSNNASTLGQPELCELPTVWDSVGADVTYETGPGSTTTVHMCDGLNWDNYEVPPGCLAPDNRQAIIDKLMAVQGSGGTPNGIALHQLAERLVGDGLVDNRFDGQRNFIILVTDGDDTCECDASFWDDGVDAWDAVTPRYLRSESTTSVPTHLAASYDATTHNDCPGTTYWNDESCFQQQNEYDRQGWNAGIKAKETYRILNSGAGGENWTAEAEAGSVFVIGLGMNEESKRRTNHLAWEASGAVYGNPTAEPALFASNADELKQKLLDIFAKLGVPETKANLGTTVVGSVKELIPKIPGLRVRDPDNPTVTREVVADDLLGDVAGEDLDDITFARRLRSQLRNNVMFHAGFELPGFKGHLKAYNVYTVSDFENDNGIREPDFQTDFFNNDPDFNSCDEPGCFWDAGALLESRYAFDRTILFNRKDDAPGTEPLEFCHVNAPGCYETTVTAADLGLTAEDVLFYGLNSLDDAVELIVRAVRGEYLSVHPDTLNYYRPGWEGGGLNFSDHIVDDLGNYHGVWKLWDPIGVGATVVQAPPRSVDMNPPHMHAFEYGNANFPDGFYWQNFNRETIVYLPTNGGMIHAFRASNGQELFAYIPADVLGAYEGTEIEGSRNTLKDFVKLLVTESNGIFNHLYLLSSAAAVEDVFLSSNYGWDDWWHTALTFGRGKGGKFVTGLDVTLPGLTWDGTLWNTARLEVGYDPLPLLMFTVGNRQGITGDGELDGLGETWSVPVIGNMEDGQWVAFFGAGYGCEDLSTMEGHYLYMIRMEDGEVYQLYRVPNDPAAPIPWNGIVATPTLYNPHQLEPADPADYVTRIYFGDVQGKIYKIDVVPGAAPDPVDITPWYELGTDQPIATSLAIYRDNADVLVFAGTGGDYRVDSTFQIAALQQLGGADDAVLLWTYDLPDGERVISNPVVGGQTIFFAGTSTAFDMAACRLRFYSTLYGVHVSTGLGTFDMDPTTGGDQDTMGLGEGKTTGMFFRDGQLYVSRSGAIGVEGDTLILGDPGPRNMNEMVPGFSGTVQVLVRGFRMSPF